MRRKILHQNGNIHEYDESGVVNPWISTELRHHTEVSLEAKQGDCGSNQDDPSVQRPEETLRM